MIINEVKKARVETDYKKFNNKQLSRVHEKQNKVSWWVEQCHGIYPSYS